MPSDASPSEQRVPKRKTHRKSRNGCFQCKQRHTKCNEDHPRCTNCVRLDIACTWPRRPGSFSLSYPTPPESHSTLQESSNREDASPNLNSDMGIADLRLLHHWTSKAYKDMSTYGHTRQDPWQVDFMEIAFEFPFLLRGFLAMSALHKAVTDPDADKQSLLLQAHHHISKALITYRENLETQRDEAAIPMFLLSSVLVTYNLASAQLETHEDPINAIHHCFRLIQGVRIVIEPHWDTVMSSKVFVQLVGDKPSIDAERRDIEEVSRLKNLAETKNRSAAEVYSVAIDDLQIAFARTRECSYGQYQQSSAFSWAAGLSEEFTHLLSVHDAIAVVILAHFAALLSEVKGCWWTLRWPQRIVFAAQKLLMSTPELLGYMDWPLQQIQMAEAAEAE